MDSSMCSNTRPIGKSMPINESVSLNELLDRQLALTNDINDIHIYGQVNIEQLKMTIKQLHTSTQPCLQLGIDEAGRGPLLGSVVIGAVILPLELTGELTTLDLTNTPLAQLNDSKKISEKKRDALYQQLHQHALAYVYVDMPAQVIDEINILQASLQGMRLAVRSLLRVLAQFLDDNKVNNSNLDNEKLDKDKLNIELLFDGNKLPELDFDLYQQWGYNPENITPSAVIKGDSKFTSIASASIIAKVERDQQMYQLAKQYPEYGIEKHKGYPTQAHLLALKQFGATDQHRQSFAPVRQAQLIRPQ